MVLIVSNEQRLRKIIGMHALGCCPSVEEVTFLVETIVKRDRQLAYADKTIANLHSQIAGLQEENLQLRMKVR